MTNIAAAVAFARAHGLLVGGELGAGGLLLIPRRDRGGARLDLGALDVLERGDLLVLYGALLVFIAANLVLGITFSTIAQNQLQSMQMMVFYYLPSMLLSGFMFPFRGMPEWAQWLGNLLPLTHFLTLIRGIMLKGNGLVESWPQIWPIVAFTLVVMVALRSATCAST